jgi:L-ribulokinase
MTAYTVGIDFGTESARAVLLDCSDGSECATSVSAYAHGVLDTRLPAPDENVELGPDWALQDPADYLRALRAAVPGLLAESGVGAEQVVGVGIDFTSCTMMPTLADGMPLSELDDVRRNPHAWVKLWKHHAAQPEADRINAVATERQEPWLRRYGGKISSEWFFAKSLQILNEAPDLYARAERLIDAGDWLVWQLTGREVRSSCTAGYKAMWSKRDGFPSNDFFAALAPAFADVVDTKMSRTITPIGQRAGTLTEQAAAWTGLLPGTPVAVANVDAHVSAPAVGVTRPGTLVAIMGTSTCHILLGDAVADVSGMCGVVEDGVIPGLYGYEAGQPAVGDLFGWFVEEATPGRYVELAAGHGSNVHDVLEQEARTLPPGANGLLALDWWNGNRSILVDADLSGLLVGMTLATRPPDVYRALLEATAFGTRVIIDAFEREGVKVDSIKACGGLPGRNRLLMEISADVSGRSVEVASSTQAPALGAAICAAVASGHFPSLEAAAATLATGVVETYLPDPGRRATYEGLYREYVRLHDLFGRELETMHVLKSLQRDAHVRA